YIAIDSKLEIEKEKICSRGIHLITSLFYAYFSFTNISLKLLSKCKTQQIFTLNEFDFSDLEGNALFKIEYTKEEYKITPNRKKFKKLIKHHNELNYLI